MKTQKKNYIVGGGIAGLACAAYLIRDGKVSGENITILEANEKMNGGSLDAEKLKNNDGYFMRGHRILDKKAYSCTFDLFSFIPSLDNPEQSVTDEIFEFNKKVKTFDRARLVANQKIINGEPFHFRLRDKLDLMRILFRSEKSLGNLRIKDYFQPSFFQTNFWFEYCTVFAFQPWHSLAEFRRYLFRAIHAIPYFENLASIMTAPYNQYESMILPLLEYLKEGGVNFKSGRLVSDLSFEKIDDEDVVTEILYEENKVNKKIKLGKNDCVFVTNGSMTTQSSIGSMNTAPKLNRDKSNTAWKLWDNLAMKNRKFGNPAVFNNSLDESKWQSFTITFRTPLFFDLMEKFSGNEAGTGGGTTLKSSNWLMSVALPHQPHFKNQPKELTVCWGYSLSVDKKGNYIKKKMSECNGEEILRELCYHLGFENQMEEIVKSAVCIPCMLPYTTSQFLPRSKGDRPDVIPKNTKNLAFIGQFCEQKDDIVFTDEYSVRSAQTSVFSLLNIDKNPTPIYKGHHSLKVLYRMIKTVFFGNFGKHKKRVQKSPASLHRQPAR